MLSLHAHLKIFLVASPCDLRMSSNGLWGAAREKLGEDPKSGVLFVFSNRRHNRIKILYFDGTGVSISMKSGEGNFFLAAQRLRTQRENKVGSARPATVARWRGTKRLRAPGLV